MTRLDYLLQSHTRGTINLDELIELAYLLIAENKLLKANGPHIKKKVS